MATLARHFIFILVLMLSGLASVLAADTPASPSEQATLTYFNRDILVFRAPLVGVSAKDRATRAKLRIHELLSRHGEHKVTQQTMDFGRVIKIDDAAAFIITPGDTDSTEQETLDDLTSTAITELTRVIEETRESRSLNAMIGSAVHAVIATAVLCLLGWLLIRLRGLATTKLMNFTTHHTEKLRLGNEVLLQREKTATLVSLAITVLQRLLLLVLVYEWLSYVLSRFPYTRSWGETLEDFLISLISGIALAVIDAIPGLVTALIIFFITRAVSRLLDRFFERIESGHLSLNWLDADVAVPTRRLAKVAIWLFALAMAFPYLPGAHTEAFKGMSVLLGLMLSLGASNLVGQAAGGLILTYTRAFKLGEYVRIGEHEGTVTEMGMFSTRIRTGLGEELTLSNAAVVGATTKNYSRVVKGAGFILDTTVTIGYDTPWRQVHAMLVEAAHRTEGVLLDPVPVVFQTALSDWYPEYRLVCQAIPAEPRPRAVLLSTLHANIQDVFNEYGVQIMSPQYFEDPAEPKLVPPENWYAAPAKGPDHPPKA